MMRVSLLGLVAALASYSTASPVRATIAASQVDPQRNVELAAFFDVYDKAQLALSPTSKTVRGIVDEDYGRWDDFSDLGAQRGQLLDRTTLIALRARFDRTRLSSPDKLSYDIFESAAARSAAAFRYRRNA